MFKDFLNLASEAEFTILGGKLFPTFTTCSLKKLLDRLSVECWRRTPTAVPTLGSSTLCRELRATTRRRRGSASIRARETSARGWRSTASSSTASSSSSWLRPATPPVRSAARHSRVVGVSGAARGKGGSFPPYGWTSKNYVLCVCFHCHGSSSYHTTNTLQGRRAKSHVDTQTIPPGLGDFVL